MSQKPCAKTYKLPRVVLRLSLLGALVLAVVALGNTGCEDKGIGRTCDVLVPEPKANQGVYNSQALECPSRICLKPVKDPTSDPQDPPTGPFCSASCDQDSDCDSSLPLRSPTDHDQTNRHCVSGYTCGIAFIVGPLCCQKLCICKDFVPKAGLPTPLACEGNGAETCSHPNTP
jgi:hypothetical protein